MLAPITPVPIQPTRVDSGVIVMVIVLSVSVRWTKFRTLRSLATRLPQQSLQPHRFQRRSNDRVLHGQGRLVQNMSFRRKVGSFPPSGSFLAIGFAMRCPSNEQLQVTLRGLLIGLLMATVAQAEQDADASDRLIFDRELLTSSAYRLRWHQQQLQSARTELANRQYAVAFQHLRALLSQPYDSAQPVGPDGPVPGIRSAVLQEIADLPLSARRSWSRFCDGPARNALNEALRSRSRTALARVAAEFPYSAAATDALITETIWAIHAHEAPSARVLVNQLRQWEALGILSRPQTQSVRRLEAAVRLAWQVTSDPPTNDPSSRQSRRLSREADWTWQESIWNHPEWPDVLPIHQPGDRFDDRDRWQPPVLTSTTVVIRTPAGIACLDRETGKEHWFLPLRSTSRARLDEGADSGAVFDITPAPDQRLEAAGAIIYFVDGQPLAPVQSPGSFRSSIVLERGATHLVAIRAGSEPAVLWQISGAHHPTVDNRSAPLAGPPVSEYTFRQSTHANSSSSGLIRTDSTAPESEPLAGHLFLSAPRVHAGRLYVTSQHNGATFLNCFSAAHGALLWQQPLSWYNTGVDEDSHGTAAVGAISDDTVVFLFAGGLVGGCSTVDGRILWLQTVLPADDEESEPDDFRLAGQADSRMIPQTGAGGSFGDLWLVRSPTGIVCGRRGSPVLCSLDARTGERQWSVSRCVQGGTADQQPDLDCIGQVGSLLIMMGYGHCRAIDSATGDQVWARAVSPHSGRVCCDQSDVFVALNNGQLLTIDGTSGRVRHIQEAALGRSGPALAADEQGLTEAAAWRVRSWSWQKTDELTDQNDKRRMLQQLVAQRLRQLGHFVDDPAEQPQETIDQWLEQSDTAALNSFDRLLLALSRPDLPGHSALLKEELSARPQQPVELLPGWILPLARAIRTLQLTIPVSDSADAPGESHSPDQVTSTKWTLQTAQELLRNGQRNEAELLLLNLKPDLNSAEAQQRHQLLQEVRAGALAPGLAPVAPAGPMKVSFDSEPATPTATLLNIIANNGRRSRLRRDRAIIPSWNDAMLTFDPGPAALVALTTNRAARNAGLSGLTAHVAKIDLERGIRTAWASADQISFPRNISYHDHWENPGLLAIQRGREVGVASLLSDDPLEPLWLRPVPQHRSGQVLALNSRQLLVCSNTGLQSFHPLSGDLQWSHVWKDSDQLSQLEGQYLKVFSTDDHVILLPSLGTGCIVLRSTDGMLLRQGARPSGRLSHVIDGYLLTATTQQQLNITHLPSGREVPVDLPDQQIVTIHPAGEIGRSKAMIVTAAPEFVILDVPTGHIDARIPLPRRLHEDGGVPVTPRLLRRSGLLYVSLGTRSWRPPYIPESVFGEPVAGNGVLLCLDPETGQLLWQHDQHPAVIPPILGDPCPFLVQWSTKYSNGGPGFRISSHHQRTSLEITILDAFSGRQVGQTVRHTNARPLQIVHDAEQRQLRIATEHTTILMHYAERR